MARIVIDARIINSSTGRYVERLLTHLQDIDEKNEYIVLVPKKDLGFWQPKNDNFHVQEANFANYSLGEQLSFALLLYCLKADLVHFCMPQQPLLYFGAHVTTVHDMTLMKTYNSDKNWTLFHLKQLVGRMVFWCVARSSRHILTPSRFTKREYSRFAGIKPGKITVTYEAADTNDFVPKKMTLPFRDYIMYVGQQSDYKNIRRLMKAHQELVWHRPDLGLVLVGAKNKSALRNQTWAEEQGYRNIRFTGFVQNEELVWLYKNCQAYAFPSLMEGFGLPALEAMAAGAPVVSSHATCLPEIYGGAAHYFDPLDAADMAQKIEQVLSDSKLRQKLIAAGYRQAARYSWQAMARQTHAVYRNALKRSK